MSLDEYLNRVKRLLIPKGDVAERAVKSGIWVTLINVFDRVLQLVKLVVLARLLAPSDFGLMGIALLTLAGLRQFSRLGLDTALIQREEDNVDEYLNTAWSMKAIRGVVITGVAFVIAPYAAQFFSEPRATDIIRVIALSPLITGLQNPGVMYLRKNLEFHKQFVYTLSSTVTNVTVAIGAAIVLQNVWALVYGSLAGSVMTFLASYVIHGYRPWPELHRGIATELFDYGKWILGSGIVLFLINQGDDAFVGWFLGASALGFYQMAYRFSNAPATEVTHIISRVIFPTYSQIQTDTEKLRTGYFRTIQIITVISFPMAIGIAVVAPTFVRAILGEQWIPIILAMQILAFWGIVRSLGAAVGPLFDAIGRPDVNTKLQTLKLVIIAIFIYPATAQWGIEGTALVIVGNAFISNPIADYLAVRAVDGKIREFIRLLLYPAISSLLMGGSVLFVQMNLRFGSQFLKFVILVLTGILIYTVAIIAVEKQFNYGLEPTLQRVISAVKG